MVEIKARKVVKLLRKNGFIETSILGDHHKFVNKDGKVTIVPYSHLGDSIAPGTLSAIQRQSGIKIK